MTRFYDFLLAHYHVPQGGTHSICNIFHAFSSG